MKLEVRLVVTLEHLQSLFQGVAPPLLSQETLDGLFGSLFLCSHVNLGHQKEPMMFSEAPGNQSKTCLPDCRWTITVHLFLTLIGHDLLSEQSEVKGLRGDLNDPAVDPEYFPSV